MSLIPLAMKNEGAHLYYTLSSNLLMHLCGRLFLTLASYIQTWNRPSGLKLQH